MFYAAASRACFKISDVRDPGKTSLGKVRTSTDEILKNKNAIAKSVDVQLKMRSLRPFENGIFSRQCPRPQRLCAHGSSCLARPRVTPSVFLCVAAGLASTATYASIIDDGK